ncbi:hypothetical protein BGX27_011362 [Mortierella sp. AM989]|nr:hypothetical protein BGX27_011362 [Mortierella sp. AM989]
MGCRQHAAQEANLLDATEIVLENEAHLIEAAFGRIKLFGGAARTVIVKLRQVLEGSDIEKELETVSSHAVQEKMRKEQEKMVEEQEKMQKEQRKQHKKRKDSTSSVKSDQSQPPRLQDYWPTGVYISMVITYPAEVVKFQIVRLDPEPELEGLERVSINIDDNNFPQIFPERHVKFLDKLKQHKRSATDEQTANPPKKSKRVMTRSATDPLSRDDWPTPHVQIKLGHLDLLF